ncbi:MAG: biopolymer transporter ExbD [Alphaproteobacteria bacterium]|nr:biopolymer transporter ExbD [Alphaproteobacteria bacterium]
MSKRVRKGDDDEAKIDMTPMLDVTFIMLIFFIVTASFTKETGLDLSGSKNNEQPPPNSKNVAIVIDITNDGVVMLEGRDIDPKSVEANVQRLRAENPEAGVVVRAGAGAQSQVMVTVIDQARKAGVGNVTVSERN